VQAGNSRTAIRSVPIRTNPELRKSRLFNSMLGYVRRSMVTILRSFMMYNPLKFFGVVGGVLFGAGFILGVRFLISYLQGSGAGHVQSLILTSILLLMGVLTWVVGMLADITAANRKILEDIQYRVRKIDYQQDDPTKPDR